MNKETRPFLSETTPEKEEEKRKNIYICREIDETDEWRCDDMEKWK
jgi:hypothetical protein